MCDYKYLKLKAKDNLKVAEYSEKKEYFDVAISRYYYYLYQNIIVYLDKNYDDFIIPEGESSHKYTISFLLKKLMLGILNFNESRRFSLLQKLRVSRRISDSCSKHKCP